MTSAKALADHYLKTAGIAAICIDATGNVTAYGTVGIDLPAHLVCFACLTRDIERLAALVRRCRGDQAAVAAQIEELAAEHYIVLSPHRVVVDRALAAVDDVHSGMQDAGCLRHEAGERRLQGRARGDAVASILESHRYIQARYGRGDRGADGLIDGRNRLMRLSRRRLQASMGRDSRRAANLRDLYSAVLRLRIEIINANLERLK